MRIKLFSLAGFILLLISPTFAMDDTGEGMEGTPTYAVLLAATNPIDAQADLDPDIWTYRSSMVTHRSNGYICIGNEIYRVDEIFFFAIGGVTFADFIRDRIHIENTRGAIDAEGKIHYARYRMTNSWRIVLTRAEDAVSRSVTKAAAAINALGARLDEPE